MWVAPAAASCSASASRTSPCTKLRFGCSASSLPDSASRCRLSSSTTSLASTRRRASAEPMNPAPPVKRMRFPESATAASLAARPLPLASSADMEGTVLFVGAGRHQRRAIRRARELGLRVVAVDRNPNALGLGEADGGEMVGFPAVLNTADSGGQRGVFMRESIDDLEAHLHAALTESPTEEAIIESYHEGIELNGLAIARGGRVTPLTLSDRLRPPGIGFGVGWIHVYPSRLFADPLAEAEQVAVSAVHALGLEDGIAFPQLIVAGDDHAYLVECAARIPGGQIADLALHAVGVALVEIALLQALGLEVPDELVTPRFQKPLAIRFLTAQPGPLPTGKVRSVGPLDKVPAFPGVVQADVFLEQGETIRPVRLDGDRRGYVIAVGDTNIEALERAEAAATLLDVEVE